MVYLVDTSVWSLLLRRDRPPAVPEVDALRDALRRGVQLGPVDALLAHLAMAGDHALLTTDGDFRDAAAHVPLRVWAAPA